MKFVTRLYSYASMQQQARLRQDQQQHMLRGMPMAPNGVGMDYNLMRFHNGINNDNPARRAQLNRGALQPYVSSLEYS